MSENHQALLRQHRNVNLRTGLSLAIYAGFLGASVLSALQFRTLEDVVTLAAIGLAVLSFLVLPRDYVPALMLRRVTTDEEEVQVDALRRMERLGLFIRVGYVLGAVITILIVPALVRPG